MTEPHPALVLLVLRCADLDMSAKFYEALGLSFEREQHGNGPPHLSCQMSWGVLELYPASQRFPAECSTRLAFRVDSPNAVELRLQKLGLHVGGAEPDVVHDPDGRRVQFF
jgi:lactoylglutathione lyase